MMEPNDLEEETRGNEIRSNEVGHGMDEDDTWSNYNNNDDDYGSSTEKYGGYNGFSDDVIDDAFEGDPEATWNVD